MYSVIAPLVAGATVRDATIDVYVSDHLGVPVEGASVLISDQFDPGDLVTMTSQVDGHAHWIAGVSNVVPEYTKRATIAVAPNVTSNSFANIRIEIPSTPGKTNRTREYAVDIFDLRGRLVGTGMQGRIELGGGRGVAGGKYFARIRGTRYLAAPFVFTDHGKYVDLEIVSRESVGKAGPERIAAVQAVDIEVTAVGFNAIASTSALDTEEPNEFHVVLLPTGIPANITGDVSNLIGDRHVSGLVLSCHTSRGVFRDTTDANGSYDIDFVVESSTDSVQVTWSHPDFENGSGVMLDSSLNVQRGRIAQAATWAASDTIAFTVGMVEDVYSTRFMLVDDMWFSDAVFKGLLGNGVPTMTRGEDRTGEDGQWGIEILRNEYDAGSQAGGDPVLQVDWDRMVLLAMQKQADYTTLAPTLQVLAGVFIEPRYGPSGLPDRAVLYIDDSMGPGNYAFSDSAGYVESFWASTPSGGSIGLKAREFYGEELTDIEPSTIGWAFDDDATLNEVGRACFTAYYLFRHGTRFGNDKSVAIPSAMR